MNSPAPLPFSPDGYRQILDTARAAGYSLNPLASASASQTPAMIVRHDVDLSLEIALRMAEAEADVGVRSTYFVLLNCDYYNALSVTGRTYLRAIVGAGHDIGLHWDSSTYPTDHDRALHVFRREVETLADAAEVSVTCASQHVPTDSPIIDVNAAIEVEAYADAIRHRFAYVSDSSMAWRQHTPLDLIATGVDIQFVSHPVWWFAEGSTRAEKLRTVPTLAAGGLHDSAESFLAYMERVLADRAAYDQRFRASRGW